jgi:NADH-quinone oxidoreductase subunit N
VNLHQAVSQLMIDTNGLGVAGALPSSLDVFLPEIVLCATIVLMLLVRILSRRRQWDIFYLAVAGALVALFLGTLRTPSVEQRMEVFTGMLVYDSFTVFMRALLLVFTVCFLVLTRLTGIPDRTDGPDIYTLVLGATVGMCLMVSSNHLLMVFMSVEIASVPCYALTGLMKGRPRASEAALKYSIYGAGAAGIMLYGISLIAGLVNTVHLPSIAEQLAIRLPTMSGDEWMVLALGGVMIIVGLAFKLSAVPFHFWCPDVFEGATAEVAALLSVASKMAALGLLVRLAIGLGVEVPQGLSAGRPLPEEVAAVGMDREAPPGLFAVQD